MSPTVTADKKYDILCHKVFTSAGHLKVTTNDVDDVKIGIAVSVHILNPQCVCLLKLATLPLHLDCSSEPSIVKNKLQLGNQCFSIHPLHLIFFSLLLTELLYDL